MSDFELRQKISTWTWVLAALVAGGIHAAGGGLALSYLQADDTDDDLGAPAIEIGFELAAPRQEPTDLPAGPDVEASAASPAVVEQKETVSESELPKAVPTETDDPDRLVSPDNLHKPKEDDPKTAQAMAVASTESIAVEATATPTSQAIQEAARSTAPALGTGESRRRARVTWEQELAVHFDKHKRYPTDRALQSAEIVVSFVLNRVGEILSTKIVKGSGDKSFDDAALEMLHRANPVPPPPPLVADDGLSFTLPVVFRVKEATAHQPKR
jgi:protein TonB